MSFLWFLIVVGLSIFVHELGHYLAARLQGVRVPVFSIGFGPPLVRFHWAGTEWRIALIPLGGFALIEGMAEEYEGGEPVGFARLSLLGKTLVLLGGVLMNLLLAWLLMALVFHVQGIPTPIETEAQIIEVLPGSLAEKAGLKPGDVVVAIDGQPLKHFTDLGAIKKKPGPHRLTVRRGDRTLTLVLVWTPEAKQIGVRYGPRVVMRRVGLIEGFFAAVGLTFRLLPQMAKSLVLGILGVLAGRPPADLVGPVGLVSVTAKAAAQGWVALANLTAMINLSLALFNLLPIPGLDGGRLLLLYLRRLLGGRLTPQMEAMINAAGLFFVFLLILMVTFQDVLRLLGGQGGGP